MAPGNVDFAIGTSGGDLYFGKFDDQKLVESNDKTKYSISNLTWTDQGFYIVT